MRNDLKVGKIVIMGFEYFCQKAVLTKFITGLEIMRSTFKKLHFVLVQLALLLISISYAMKGILFAKSVTVFKSLTFQAIVELPMKLKQSQLNQVDLVTFNYHMRRERKGKYVMAYHITDNH